MGFRPMPNIESTLIKFNMADPRTYEKHIQDINKTLARMLHFKLSVIMCIVQQFRSVF